jgi:uncharacterized protein YndB with AHSA1/START domain
MRPCLTREEDDPRVGGQWRIATLSRRGKRSPAAGVNDINKSIKSITRKFVLHVLTDNVTRGSRTKLYSTVCSPRVDSDVHAVQELN